MLKDGYGLEVTTTSVEARDAYVEAADRMLAANARVEERLAAAIDADPDFALPHAAVARQHQTNGRPKEARAAAERATRLAGGATAREQQHVEIVRLLVSGRVPDALALTRQHVAEHPLDALALAPSTGVFGTIGFSGRIGREVEQLELLEPLATHYGDDWWFQTVLAFALIETGQWERGRRLAERSLEQRPDTAHGAHTLAHALYESGDDDEATSFLADWLPTFDEASLLHCHIWWHYAILLMTAGRHDAARQALSENCLPGRTGSPSINVVTDAASFLWRSELAGAPRDHDSWRQVRDYADTQFRRPIVFVDAHVGLAHAALGDTDRLAACITQLHDLGEDGRLPAGTTAATLTQAYGAFVGENWAQVIEILEPAIDQAVRIGGSRAQRDLVANTLLAAYVNDDRLDDAAAFLASAHDRRPSRPIAGLDLGSG